MPNRAWVVQEILSGRRRSFGAALARGALWTLSVPYRAVIAFRNACYDRGLRSVSRFDRPVISVGNLTVGGTGKTPLVELIARHLLTRTDKLVLISRGYGSESEGEKNDEAKALEESLPGVPHVIGKDRVACAAAARRKHDAQVLLLDDAFQHRRIARDLDVVAVDATCPFGFGYVLPRGLLRESPKSLRRAGVVVITRSALVTPEELAAVESEVARLAPKALVVRAEESVTNAGELAGKRVVAFAGLGNPDEFRRTVTKAGAAVAAFLVFSDHHHYAERDLRVIDRVATEQRADAIVTTQKDTVKVTPGFDWHAPLVVVKMEMRLAKNADAFLRRIDEVLGNCHA
jgi:tetraacyldisaccharide 4'-kinase